jgi:hypothetical protein
MSQRRCLGRLADIWDRGFMRDQWEQQAANELKAQIKRAGLAYADLAEKLSVQDMPITAHGLAKKLQRGAFSYAFYLRCVDLLAATQQTSRYSVLAKQSTSRMSYEEEGEDVQDLPLRSG